MSEQSGRYQRSMSGMVGALVVTLVAIAAFVAWRALNRNDVDVRPEAVDYLASVSYLQEAGRTIVYPPSLPKGWTATSANYGTGRDLSWDMGALTASDEFAGVRQEDASVDQLVSDYVDPNAEEGEAVQVDGAVATTWRSFSDDGGDFALVAELREETVLVYGSADPDEIEALAASLVTTPLQ
ncbi:DUF4245 domain-containing protein [Nocardioides sp.]|uniref:DUF4245 domain-containing protein n=1 Tax=Nocardioides sp. TaxID=35761 RepID=UPI003D111F88